jgi:hypothetical protein
MLAEQAILREAQDKIAALRQPKEALLIEAAVGSVVEVVRE